jgi:hypothetical protein
VKLERNNMTDVLPPGQGTHLALVDQASLPRDRRVRFTARGLDGAVQAETTPAQVKREWLDPLLHSARDKRQAWSGASADMAVAILPASPAVKKTAEDIVRGRMDPEVLRNALSLAFMPRARACYLARRVAKASDVRLQGRIKLELTLERGELHDALVRSSTLGSPEIEACVRNAAWAIEYPRPEHRDAPTVANLNLVFRPHSPEEAPPDASPADREIELILGPLGFPTDFKDLLETNGPDKSPAP